MNEPAIQLESARIDRFRLLRRLGCGAQGVVYVGHDPQLDRQVAIKTLQLGENDPYQAEMLLAGARTASSLSHPNIVPVFEVGMHAGQPFVVFEYVEGRTLADVLQAEGALPMTQAVILMSQILAGMAHVHASGVLHGDIKPANVLIGANGIPRVTDFGISRRALAAAGEAVSSGTVQYMAPECLSEGRADYRSDVFALGLLFYEMLTGQAAVAGSNEYAQIYRILNETPKRPSALNARIDRRLDAIVLKALQRDPWRRYDDAGQMKLDLDRFRVPVSQCETRLEDRSMNRSVEPLLRKMALKSDFPALSTSLNRINELCSHAGEASLRAITDLVMRDFALTQKILRLVNSAAFGAGKVQRMSQAIALLGLSRLRAVAAALILASGGRSRRRCPAVAAALTDAFVAGLIARNVGRLAESGAIEELFISGMFSRLGHIVTLYYLREEHEAILRRIADEGTDSASASQAVLGVSFEEFGIAVARHWNFPEAIVAAMQPLPPGMALDLHADEQRLWLCTAFARELCTLARECPRERLEAAFCAQVARYDDLAQVDTQQIRILIAHSIETARCYIAAAELSHEDTALLDGLRMLARPSHGAEARFPDAAYAAASNDRVAGFAPHDVGDPSLDTVVLMDLQPRAATRPALPSRRH